MSTDPNGAGPKNEPNLSGFLWVWGVSLLILFLFLYFTPANEVSYTDFRAQLAKGNIESLLIEGDAISGEFREDFVPDGSTIALSRFSTAKPPVDDPALLEVLQDESVRVVIRSSGANSLWVALFKILPWLFLLWLLFRWLGRSGKGGLPWSYGNSKAVLYRKSAEDLSFKDVAGLKHAKGELLELVDFLKDPAKYQKLGAKSPQGILLMGPPGTGKTLMARAVAGEADVPFFSISGSQFIEMFVGVGASRVRSLFEDAKKNAPSIIFIDEIDSVGRARGTGLGGGHDEREQTLNQILAEMDGFSKHDSVVVLAATNRPDVLDPALTRPGRFDRKVLLDLPQRAARLEILQLHTRGVPLTPEVDLSEVAAGTYGYSGADLQNLVNEAALQAARRNGDSVTVSDFELAQDRIALGLERDEVLGDEDRERVAYHEAGHALLALTLPNADPLRKVTIIPRGRALGVTEQIPSEDHSFLTKEYLQDQLVILMGGRAAVKLLSGTCTSGASNDLAKATQLAKSMVTRFGMTEELGAAAFGSGDEYLFLGREMAKSKDYSEHTNQLIDQEIVKLVNTADRRALELLEERRGQLDLLASHLLQHETLEREEILSLIERNEAPPSTNHDRDRPRHLQQL